MRNIKDFEWYENNIDNNEECLYPNDGDMCVYMVATLSKNEEYIIIFRDLPERTLRCRLSLFEPKYIGLSGSEYDLILSDKDKVKLMSILTNTWKDGIEFLKEEYTYHKYNQFNKDLNRLPNCPPNYLLLKNTKEKNKYGNIYQVNK